jgi:hypothetical protein
MTVCKTQTLEIDAYSAATAKRERVLYRYTGECTQDGIGALGWARSGNSVVAMVNVGTVTTGSLIGQAKVMVGVVAGGKLIPLLAGTLLLRQGPGMIAF